MIATSNIPLKVTFKEKDEAKSLGARWNPEGKHWYVPEGIDASLFEKWIDGAVPQVAAKTTPQNPSQARASSQAQPLTRQNNTNALPKNADLDDINAMLREAYEPIDDGNFDYS